MYCLHFQGNEIADLHVPPVGFYAYSSVSLTWPALGVGQMSAGVAIFDTEVTDLGNNYEPGSGIFTGTVDQFLV